VTDRRALYAWAAVLVPTWLVLVLCTHWEPVIGDGWGHLEYHTESPLSLHSIWTFAKYNYLELNPRLGQTVTMLLFTPGPWHAIATPLVELALFWLLTTLALGRWPSLRRLDDALLFATILALVAACAPLFGQMLFYRPYTGNYLYGLVLCLAFLVPYRLDRDWPWWTAAPMLILGAAAGLSNEHTGPAFALAAIAATVYHRRLGRPRAWQIAGIVGIVAGGLALFFAPGQDLRYNELATQQSLLARIASRGIDNFKPFGQVAAYLTPALAWVALAFASRRTAKPEPIPRERVIATLALAAMAFVILVTLLASPKLGLRLFLASVALACTAIASWVVPQLATRWARTVAWAGAAAVLLYVLVRCALVYHVVGAEYAARIDALTHAAPHSRVTVPVYSVGKSRWFFGDDFLLGGRLESVAQQFELDAVELSVHRDATLLPDEP
jgi:hypothetical protein